MKPKPKEKLQPKQSPKPKAKPKGGTEDKVTSKGVTGQLRKGKFKKVSQAVAQQMMEALCRRYPDAECELTYKNDFELLTAVILSAQTTDANVNKVTPALFKKFPTAKALAEANLDDVKELVRSTGYYNAKAKNIQSCAQALVSNFGGQVPSNIDDLTTLPGVGRKTANVVLGVIHNVPGWTVDTHVQRLCKRLGLSELEDPVKIEMELQKLFPKQDWTKYSITLIWHGRRICFARNPDCPGCPISDLCPSSTTR
jgi:endonuclease III